MRRLLFVLALVLAIPVQSAWAVPDLQIADGEIKKFWISVDDYTWADIVAYDHYIKEQSQNPLRFQSILT